MAVKLATLALAVVLISDSATAIEFDSPAVAQAIANRLRDPDSMRLHKMSRQRGATFVGWSQEEPCLAGIPNPSRDWPTISETTRTSSPV
jgi:hypothetical protein